MIKGKFDGFGYDINEACWKGNIFERVFHQSRLAFWMSADFVGKRVLDVGCNTGILLMPLLERGIDAIGVDISEQDVAKAKENLKAKGFSASRVRRTDANKLPFNNESFDRVMLSDILEHVSRPELVVREALRVVKVRGVVIASVPNEKHPVVRYRWVRRFFTGRDNTDEYQDAPYSMEKLIKLFSGAGLIKNGYLGFGSELYGVFRKL